jgi:hypothetical protein
MFTNPAADVIQTCSATVVDTATDSTTVYTGRCYLVGIYVNTVLSAHTVVISDGASALFTLPASLAAGTKINFENAEFLTSLIVDPNDSSTGNITVMWSPA